MRHGAHDETGDLNLSLIFRDRVALNTLRQLPSSSSHTGLFLSSSPAIRNDTQAKLKLDPDDLTVAPAIMAR